MSARRGMAGTPSVQGRGAPAVKPKRRMRLVEDQHQAALFRWVKMQVRAMPALELLHAIPNGGQRSKVTAALLSAQGVRAGVPDLDLPVPSQCGQAMPGAVAYVGLRIELKRPIEKGEAKPQISPHQERWLTLLQAHGHCCCVCFGWEEARDSILAYLRGQMVPHQYRPKEPT